VNLNISKIKIWALTALAAAGSFSALAQPTNTVSPKDFEAFKIITDRNIFDVNRRPRVAGVVRPPSQPVDTFVLTGTMSYESGPFAVFDGSTSEYHKVLGPGGKIAGYTLAEITHDFVKLSSGTNELELKVGMQMHRSENGKWSVGERGENSYASNSDSRSRNPGRNDRNDRRSSSFSTGTNFRSAAGQGGENPPPTDAATLDPSDPVARLMLRRLQETGGNVNQTANAPPVENPDGAEGNQNAESNTPGENRNQRPTGPNDTRNPALNRSTANPRGNPNE
jgi:hypothetical protein